jgi:hypothetical protein
LENKITVRESQGACRQDELTLTLTNYSHEDGSRANYRNVMRIKCISQMIIIEYVTGKAEGIVE